MVADALSRQASSYSSEEVTQQAELIAELNSLQLEIVRPRDTATLCQLTVQSTIII